MNALRVAAVAAVTLSLAGCAWISPNKVPEQVPESERTSLPTQPAPAVSADPELAAAVPEWLAQAGVLTFATEPDYAPLVFTVGDNLSIVGVDVEIGDAVAATLGLESRWSGLAFDRLLPTVEAGEFDASMSALTITDQRLREVNMVSYLRTGTAWAVKRGLSDGINPESPCGRTVAVQLATVQVTDLERRSATCTADGKAPITIEFFAAQSAASQALLDGSVDAFVADSPVVAYLVERNPGALEQAGESYDESLLGIAVASADDELADLVARALQSLIQSGAYGEILARWGLADSAVATAELNPQV